MKIRQISYSLLGGLMLAGISTGCSTDDTYLNKAKERAVEYINGYDLLRAERAEKQQFHDDRLSASTVMYWDSVIMDAKAKEAYIKGQQMVRDSADGKFFRKEKYKANLDTIIGYGLIENQKEECAKYVSAMELIRLRDNAPSQNGNHDGYASEFPYEVHYWDLITIAAKQQEAYNKGASDERAKLNNH